MLYDIIMQNNASREFYLLQGLTDMAPTELYLQFNNVELDIPEGEYTYACFVNDRDDVVYEYKTPLLDTIVHTDEEDIVLKNLQPYTGLLRVGTVGETNLYDSTSTNYPYDGVTEENNNDLLYYEG